MWADSRASYTAIQWEEEGGGHAAPHAIYSSDIAPTAHNEDFLAMASMAPLEMLQAPVFAIRGTWNLDTEVDELVCSELETDSSHTRTC